MRGANRVNKKKSVHEFSIEESDKELIAGGAQVPDAEKFNFPDKEGTPERNAMVGEVKELYKAPPSPNKELAHINTWDLSSTLIFNTRSETDFSRGTFDWEEGLDWYEIPDEQILQNCQCVAGVCPKDNLTDLKNGFFSLKTKIYGETFNLGESEPFYHQPTSQGTMCSGFLVSGDMIVTSSPFINKGNIKDTRFIFGYRMSGPMVPETRFPAADVYHGVEIIHHEIGENRDGWTLVKLDRKVQGQTIARISDQEIFCDQPLYVIGHPLGLPLKCSSGASIVHVTSETYFSASLNIYSSNSGSPVFDLDTHEVIGMVTQGVSQDFRWTGKGWISVIYPAEKGSSCINISGIIPFIK